MSTSNKPGGARCATPLSDTVELSYASSDTERAFFSAGVLSYETEGETDTTSLTGAWRLTNNTRLTYGVDHEEQALSESAPATSALPQPLPPPDESGRALVNEFVRSAKVAVVAMESCEFCWTIFKLFDALGVGELDRRRRAREELGVRPLPLAQLRRLRLLVLVHEPQGQVELALLHDIP